MTGPRYPPRRTLLHRGRDHRRVLPPGLSCAAEAGELLLLPKRSGGGSSRLPPVPPLPAGSDSPDQGDDEASRLVRRATLLLEEGVPVDSRARHAPDNPGAPGDHSGAADLATGLGVAPEHLERVFVAESGVSPGVFAQTARMLFAKRLLTDTDLTPDEVAAASDLHDAPHLDAVFRERYRLDASSLRRRRESEATSQPGPFRFNPPYRPPFDWDALLLFLGRRAVGGVEAVVGDTYYRTVHLEHRGTTHVGWISARPSRTKPALELQISRSLEQALRPLLSRAALAFDLACSPQTVGAALEGLAARHPGLRLPGAWDGSEILTRAILGQQVTVGAARTFATRLTELFGDPVADAPAGLTATFPSAARLAGIAPEDIQALGVVGARARALVAAAQAMVKGEVRISPGDDPEQALVSLLRLKGVGDWTAQYVVMRALSWQDAFLPTDRGIVKALEALDTEDEKRGSPPRQVSDRGERWAPWRSYAVMHLWQSLEDGL